MHAVTLRYPSAAVAFDRRSRPPWMKDYPLPGRAGPDFRLDHCYNKSVCLSVCHTRLL